MKRIAVVAVVLGMLLVGCELLELFQPYTSLPVIGVPQVIASGDFNNDGRKDVVVGLGFPGPYGIRIYYQDSSGELKEGQGYSLPAQALSIDSGDVNNDGLSDIVVGTIDYLVVFTQNFDGSFSSRSYATKESASLKIGDLNGDGLNDVVSAGHGSNKAEIRFQQTDGSFSLPTTLSVNHGGFDELDIGDLNGDGLNDIVVMSGQGYGTNFSVICQKAGGSFEAPVYYSVGENILAHGVGIDDINDDGLNDVVLAVGGNRPSSQIISFLQVQGRLLMSQSTPTYDVPEAVEVRDVNNDGKADVVVAHGGWMAMGVHLQQADRALSVEGRYAIPYASHYNHQGMVVSDINGDNLPDVAIADSNGKLVVLYHTLGADPVVDIKANGSDGPVVVPNREKLEIDLTIDPTSHAGQEAKYFLSYEGRGGKWWLTPNGRFEKMPTPTPFLAGAAKSVEMKLDNRNLPHDVVYQLSVEIGNRTFNDQVTVRQK